MLGVYHAICKSPLVFVVRSHTYSTMLGGIATTDCAVSDTDVYICPTAVLSFVTASPASI